MEQCFSLKYVMCAARIIDVLVILGFKIKLGEFFKIIFLANLSLILSDIFCSASVNE